MLKKLLPVLILPLLLAGCAATLTNLTPQRQVRNDNNLYTVEVALSTRQQTLRWDSIRPQIIVGTESYKMHPTPMMTNRWEGLVPVPADSSVAHYHYRFDYEYNAMGAAKTESVLSQDYTLQILNK